MSGGPSSVFLLMEHLSKTNYENVYALQKTLNPAFPLDNISSLNIEKTPPSWTLT